MNFVAHDDRFWLTCTRRRKRVAAIEASPRVALAITSRGTDIGVSQTVTYKGNAIVHDDAAVKRGSTRPWRPASARRRRPASGVRAPPRQSGPGRHRDRARRTDRLRRREDVPGLARRTEPHRGLTPAHRGGPAPSGGATHGGSVTQSSAKPSHRVRADTERNGPGRQRAVGLDRPLANSAIASAGRSTGTPATGRRADHPGSVAPPSPAAGAAVHVPRGRTRRRCRPARRRWPPARAPRPSPCGPCPPRSGPSRAVTDEAGDGLDGADQGLPAPVGQSS